MPSCEARQKDHSSHRALFGLLFVLDIFSLATSRLLGQGRVRPPFGGGPLRRLARRWQSIAWALSLSTGRFRVFFLVLILWVSAIAMTIATLGVFESVRDARQKVPTRVFRDG